MWVAFPLQKLLTFFFSKKKKKKKISIICVSLDVNFNESLTNDVVSLEQLGPDCHYNEFCRCVECLYKEGWL